MPRARATLLAFVTAAVTLELQILVHRMVSAKLLNNYAFLVISLTMLGFAFSGVILSFRLKGFLAFLNDSASACAALCTLTTLGASAAFYQTHTGTPSFLYPSFLDLATWIPFALLFAAPFAFTGLTLGALLSSKDLSARRIYFADLAGSSFGAVAVISAIRDLGVETSVLCACGFLLGGTLLLLPPSSPRVRGLVAIAVLALGCSAVWQSRVFDLYYPASSFLSLTRDPRAGVVLEHVAWDPLARIEVARLPSPDPSKTVYPSLLGQNRAFLARFKRMLTQNNYAFTYAVDYDGTRESLRGIEETIYAAAYRATSVPRPRVAVIGVGGGFDVLTALTFDASEVTAVEVNAATVGILKRTYRDYFRRWVEDPRVHLVQDEGRRFLASSQQRYDVIQLSGVDSYSGTPGAAYVFSENYLYTAEAFDLYLSRLTPDGIVNMMRREMQPPREMLRALTTVVAALRRIGIERPADHIVTITEKSGNFTALLAKRTPFTQAELERLEGWRSPFFSISAAPGLNKPVSLYGAFLSLGTARREQTFTDLYPFDVSPTTDDRPFFFRYSFWWHLFSTNPLVRGSVPVMEYSLLVLLVVVGLAAVVCVYVPLRYFAGQGLKAPGAGRYGLFFAGTGIGYLAIEVALLQKYGLFLGHPNYSLSVVLAALLFTTGIGALVSESIVRTLGGIRFASYALAGVVLGEYLLLLPRLGGLVGLDFSTRAALVVALVAPIGVLLGVFVPTAIERMKPTAPDFVPWAWGINGVFSVLAPILSVAVSMTCGIGALLLAALPVYLAVGWSLPDPARSRATTTP